MFGEWLIYAVASIVCWGFINVMDSYFVESRIYGNELDGLIISAMFKIVGFVLIGSIFYADIAAVSFSDAILSMLGGALISAAYLFYFAAMFYRNDAPLIQIAWILSSPLVVLMGRMFLREEFSLRSYIGMGIIFLGAFAVSLSKETLKHKMGKFALLMIPMIILYSSSEIVMKYVEEMRDVRFQQSFPFLCLGQVIFGSFVLMARRKKSNIAEIIGKNWRMFFCSEGLELVGLFFMQLAIAKTPSISLFGVVEAFMPVMVIILTGMSVFLLKIFKRGKILQKIYEEKMLSGLPTKIVAVAAMMVGVYFI